MFSSVDEDAAEAFCRIAESDCKSTQPVVRQLSADNRTILLMYLPRKKFRLCILDTIIESYLMWLRNTVIPKAVFF
ncbi:GL12890 [Drosophila persimilis]|uniref:GL12890 n=1 Tax=Drosophila persimilis TaxID=7234 RepID=B4GV82_DROPE|nr:GL12890 [Drosophila persimilis]